MLSLVTSNRTFFSDETPRPLGRFTLAGTNCQSAGLNFKRLRVYGRFALVLLVEGRGHYLDARGVKSEVVPGDAILVTPELPHAYGPRPAKARGATWNEIYLCFDGPLFELWRREGVLDDSRPVQSVANWPHVFARMEALAQSPRPSTLAEHQAQLRELLAILALCFAPREAQNAEPAWMQNARALLESNLDQNLGGRDAARAAKMSYEAFRKAWTTRTGVSPTRYRDEKRLDAAQILLKQNTMTQAQIARSLGWRDEAHLSRRFRELVGLSVREWKALQTRKLQSGTRKNA